MHTKLFVSVHLAYIRHKKAYNKGNDREIEKYKRKSEYKPVGLLVHLQKPSLFAVIFQSHHCNIVKRIHSSGKVVYLLFHLCERSYKIHTLGFV